LEISSVKGKTALLISAVGDPAGFEKTVVHLGISIIGHAAFRDHYDYTAKDLNRVINRFKESGSKMILTTEKDFIKIESFIDNGLPLFAVPIEVKFSDQDLNTILDEIISIPQTRS
jgi:tetraacyldisaccharide 4'-kinase